MQVGLPKSPLGRSALVVLVLAGVWFIAVDVIAEALIQALYAKTLSFGTDLITQSSDRPVEYYLVTLRRLAWTFFPAMALFALLVMWSRRARVAIVLIILLAAWVRFPSIFTRAVWGDESYTLIQTAGHAPPEWPTTPSTVSSVKYVYEGAASLQDVSRQLRETDVHPPFYYWAVSIWRRVFGYSVESIRLFSLLCSTAAVFVFYLLLRDGRLQMPAVPTLIFGLSAYAAYFGGVARNYAMATLLILTAALCAVRAIRLAGNSTRRQAFLYSVGAGLCSGAAFQTHYFALFPVAVILGWLFVFAWSRAKEVALAGPLASLAVALIEFSALLQKMAARPRQQGGFLGVFQSLKAIAMADVHLFWQPIIPITALDLPMMGAGVLLLVATGWLLTRERDQEDKRFWMLLAGLGLAPSLAIFVLDLTGKNFHNPQYLLLGAPALAALLAYPLTTLSSIKPLMKTAILVVVWALQMVCINWGLETGPTPAAERKIRTAARAIAASDSPSQLVVIDQGCADVGAGCGFQHAGAFLYELQPQTRFVTFGDGSDANQLYTLISSYQDVWLGIAVVGLNRSPGDGSHDGIVPLPPTDVRKQLMVRLRESGCFDFELQPGVMPELYRLRKREECGRLEHRETAPPVGSGRLEERY